MRKLSTTIAVYADVESADQDWADVESAAGSDQIYLADSALVRRAADGTVERLERESHHGWGKGAVAGAVVGILFPASIVAGAVVGGVGGGLMARMNRSLDRGDIKDLGQVMDSGEIALVVVTSEDTSDQLKTLLGRATASITKASASAEEVREALDASLAKPTT